MHFRILRRYSMAKRYKKIIDVLIKYEFGHLVDQMKLRPFQIISSRWKQHYELGEEALSGPERMRKVLEELGPTYVKLGQILSMRQDLIPLKYAEEFAKLQDAVPPFAIEDVERLIKEELEAPIDDLFGTFEREPIAAASIGQVHLAKLKDGADVVVKVQRPRIDQIIETDLDIMYSLAKLAEEHISDARYYRPVNIVDEFSISIHAELDYTQEARNIDRFSYNFKADPHIYIPKIYWDYSSQRILTIEYIDGTKGNDFETIENLGHDRQQIAIYGAKAFMKQVFEDGLFHADIHPGNVFILDDGRIALIDFGMVGHLSNDLRNAFIDCLLAITKGDVEQCIEILYDFDVIGSDVDIHELKTDIEHLLDKYYGRSLKQMDAVSMLSELLGVLRRHQARIPANIALLLRGVIMITGFGTQMMPDFNIAMVFEPCAKKIMKQRLSPKYIANSIFKDMPKYSRMLHKMPMQISHILSSAESGDLNIKFEHHGLDRIVMEMNAASNRLAFSFIISAIIVGSSLIIQTGMEPLIWGFPFLGLLGFMMAVFFGMGLVIYILKTGRI